MPTNPISAQLRRGGRLGSRPEHGTCHSHDHKAWSRRQFLTRLGTALGGTVTIANTPLHAYGSSSLHRLLTRIDSDRILVLIQLNGGNDGLNTVIPYANDTYYRVRPSLAIPAGEAQGFRLSDTLGLHPSLSPLRSLYDDGRLAVVQGVGYPDPNLSHFRSTDIWLSGSDADSVVTTGWAGRYLDEEVPDFADAPPEKPLALQIGGTGSLLFRGPEANMGMTLVNTDLFDRLAEGGLLFDVDQVPNSLFGSEIAFVRSVANESFAYAGAIQSAAAGGANRVTYPNGNPLAGSLSIAARLIKGGLGARIYHVSLGGFDTHAGQANVHASLLGNLAEALQLFYQDLEADGHAERVLGLTFSEFGRRVEENGSGGTDHGSAAPLFVIGTGIAGGVLGPDPAIDAPDAHGNLPFAYDFRSLYGTVLQDWFGAGEGPVTNTLLGFAYDRLPLFRPSTVASHPVPPAPGESLPAPAVYPNPFSTSATIEFMLATSGPVELALYDAAGRRRSLLVERTLPPGLHRIQVSGDGLESGAYYCRLTHGGTTRTATLVRVR